MSPTNPSVTVIIPTYNRAHLLGRSIRSVLEQTYRDFELLVVDDASTDNTAEVVASFTDERIKYIRRDKNGGAGAARNTGIGAAGGEFLAFNDSDDEWLPSKLQRQMDIFATLPSNVGVVYTDMWRIEEGRKTYLSSPHIMPHDKITRNIALRHRLYGIGTQSIVIRRECIEKAGVFSEDLPALEDSELLIRIAEFYDFYHLAEPLVDYHVHGSGIMHNPRAVAEAWQLMLDKYRNDLRKEHKTLARYHANAAFWLFLSREPQEGNAHLFEGANIHFAETYRCFSTLASTIDVFSRKDIWRTFIYLLGTVLWARQKRLLRQIANRLGIPSSS